MQVRKNACKSQPQNCCTEKKILQITAPSAVPSAQRHRHPPAWLTEEPSTWLLFASSRCYARCLPAWPPQQPQPLQRAAACSCLPQRAVAPASEAAAPASAAAEPRPALHPAAAHSLLSSARKAPAAAAAARQAAAHELPCCFVGACCWRRCCRQMCLLLLLPLATRVPLAAVPCLRT